MLYKNFPICCVLALLVGYSSNVKFGFQPKFSQEELIPYRKGDHWGYVNQQKNIKIPVKYTDAYPFIGSLANVEENYISKIINKEGETVRTGAEVIDFLEKSGNYIIESISGPEYEIIDVDGRSKGCCFDPIGSFKHELARVGTVKGNNWRDLPLEPGPIGFIDEYGKVIIPLVYDQAEHFVYQYVWARKNGKHLLLSTKGEIVMELDAVYKSPAMVCDSVFLAKKGSKSVLVNINGKIVFENVEGLRLLPFYYGNVLMVKDHQFMGILDCAGNIILEAKYQDILPTGSATKFWIKNESGAYFLRDKDAILSAKFQFGDAYSNTGFIWATKNGRGWGFLDLEGKEITEFQYDGLRNHNHFSNGMAPVVKANKMGFINDKGELVLPLKYKPEYGFSEVGGVMNHFRNGYCRIQTTNGKYGYIDKKGNEYFED